MTRRDWDKLERVLRECQLRPGQDVIPAMPSAVWMHRRIVNGIADAFELTGEARALYTRMAGVT